MRERPILFSGPMVRAILEGRKTQTRRALKAQPRDDTTGFLTGLEQDHLQHWPTNGGDYTGGAIACPYGQPGDRLWVKETIRKTGEFPGGYATSEYVADGMPTVADAWPWQRRTLVSIHCPRGLSRITLEITRVRVEPLQQISESDALAEGIDPEGEVYGEGESLHSAGSPVPPGRYAFATLWRSINGDASWEANPWVWVVEFHRVRP